MIDPYIQLPRVPMVGSRHQYVVERCIGKRVLHLGCVDTGLLEPRFQAGELLHQKLAQVVQELWGADIDVDGIAFLNQQGFDNLVVLDVTQLDQLSQLESKSWDVIVASEILEHLSNPGLFLDGVKPLMQRDKTILLVTVPNAFRLGTLAWLIRGVELVHPDHNYWFSYHTITTLLQKHGYSIEEMAVYAFLLAKKRLLPDLLKSSLARIFYRLTPFWGDGLIVVAKLSVDGSS